MKKFWWKFRCFIGSHPQSHAVAFGAVDEDAKKVIRIVVFCPACKFDQAIIDVDAAIIQHAALAKMNTDKRLAN